MKLKAVVLATALVIGGLASLALFEVASAATLPLNTSNTTPQSAETELPIQKVGHRGGGRRRFRRGGGRRYGYRRGGGRNRGYYRSGGRRYGYHRGRHGPRYHYRRGRYRHYYNGYWYGVPFWLGAAAVAGSYYYAEPAPADSGHVEWCLDRYRSYRPRLDTFRGYDGYDHRCISPYSY